MFTLISSQLTTLRILLAIDATALPCIFPCSAASLASLTLMGETPHAS